MTNKYETRPKKSKTIPFGYSLSPYDPKLLLPIPDELDALLDAFFYLRTCSYRKVVNWLVTKTGRKISDVGLLQLHKKWKKDRNETYYENRKRKAKTEKLKELDRQHSATTAEAQKERTKDFVSREAGGERAESSC